MQISVVSPVYKAEMTVDELVKRIIDSVSNITNEFEIILIDDGSPDDSWACIERNCKKDSRVKGIKLTRNFGQHHAITCGLDYAFGDWVVVMDCDLQDLPEEIPRLYQKAKQGFDVVLARRENRKDTVLKRFQSWLFYKLFNFLTDMNYDSSVGVFRIISRRVVDHLRRMREQHRFFIGLVEWASFPTTSLWVQHGKRTEGKSTYTFSKLLSFAIDVITSYSDKPLRVFTLFGFVISLLAFLFGSYILFRKLMFGSPVTGWSSLIVSLYFLSGIIVMILGIIGTYLGKTYDEVKKRPLYVISKSMGFRSGIETSPTFEVSLTGTPL